MGLTGQLSAATPAWPFKITEEDRIIDAYTLALKDGPANTYRVWRAWQRDRKLKYIEHMKRCAAADPERFVLFSDIVASATAHSLEGL